MKKLALLAGIFLVQQLSAQTPDDILRSAWTRPSGTAREQAIGGAMGSLGGDISAASVNPAGLGMYKTNEFVLSPGFRLLTDKGNYRGTGISGTSANNFNLGASGLVLSYSGRNGGSNVFVLSVNQMANFSSNIHYKGQNNYSSFSEQYVEEFAASGLSIDGAIGSSALSYGTRMALYTYLVDTATINGQVSVIGQPEKAGLLNQDNHLRTSGGITEIGLSLAANSKDKWYFGGTLGIPILSYTRNQTYQESDATGNTNNDFESFTYQETYTTRGAGLNLKLGLLFKPNASWRVGLAVHTPTIFGLTDKVSASMVARTENYTSYKQLSISSDSLDAIAGTNANSINYNLYTPWKFLLSGSYVIGGESEDIHAQKGFVTADVEYTAIKTAQFRPVDQNTDASYYDAVNSTIKSYYRGSLGVRLGGELKFNTLMARAGVAYYSDPYADSQLKADRLFLSGGVGYRDRGMFIDLTYVQGFSRDINFPYRLSDKANTFATLKENGGTVLVTVGFKF
jgi:hypothetical protein